MPDMDFSFTPEQEALKQATIEFAQRELNHDLAVREKGGSFSREDWRKCADFGILGLNVPREYGGQNHDIVTTLCILEALGYGCRDNGLSYGLNSQLWSTQVALQKFGDESQKQRDLGDMYSGKTIGAFAITEADSGSDTYSMKARAKRVEDGYIVNAEKHYITNAPIAEVSVVFASTDPDAGKWGISAFIVDTGSEGFSRGPDRDKMGLKTSPFGELYLDDCFVPEANRLGPEGAGVSIFAKSMESERGYILSSQLGARQRQLEEAVAFARERRQFSHPIGRYQSVSNRIVDMKLRLETCRLMLYRLAWLDTHEKNLAMDAALTKLHLSESFIESSLDAIRLHGAQGYVQELGIERDLRDGIGGVIYSGTSDIQRNVVARFLGL
jgi:alkylation response protein AidB-like acyl-CoA dehydrogenase